MTNHDFFPPLLDLSPDEIRAHNRHLLNETAREPKRARRPLFVAVAAAAAGAAAAIAVALVPSAGVRVPTSHSAAPPLAPFYSFHASVTSTSPGDRYYAATSFARDGDHVISLLDDLTLADVESRNDIPRAVLEFAPRAVFEFAATRAHAYGNRGPTLVEWVKTTRQKAVSAENAGRVDGGSRSVYFVILHGHFVYETASRPHGARLPRGRILTDTIDIKTGRTLDFGIGNGEPDFSKTGTPHHFVIVYRHRRSR